MKVDRVSRRTCFVLAAAAACAFLGVAAPAEAFRASSSPCDLIRSNLEKVLGLPQVWERPTIGKHGKNAPDVASSCKIEAWDGTKPTSKKELDERIVRGSAAIGYIHTWVANPHSPDVAKWRHRLFLRTLEDAIAGCAALDKDPEGAKLRLPLDGAQSSIGYQGVKVGLDACGVWDRGSRHPSTRTTAGRSPSERTDPGDYRIITIQLQQSPQKPVATDLTGIAKYLVGGFWHTNALPLLHLYWTNFCTGDCDTSDGTINEANLDGSNPHVIVTGEAYPGFIADHSSHLYWSDEGGGNSNQGTIREADLDGSNAHTIVAGQNRPLGVAVDAGDIYWTSLGSIGSDGTIWEGNPAGNDPHVIVSGLGEPSGLAVNNSHLYWSLEGGTIDEANLDGSSPHAIVTGQDDPVGIALTNSHVYWADAGNPDPDAASPPDISKANLDGSNPQTVLTSSPIVCSPLGLATGANKVYWDNDSEVCDPTINQATVNGSSPQTLITGEDYPFGLVVGP